MTEFKVGQQVRVEGFPCMTVKAIDGANVTCTWYDGKVHEHTFPAAMLQRYEPPVPKGFPPKQPSIVEQASRLFGNRNR